jgi:hypothetical protein
MHEPSSTLQATINDAAGNGGLYGMSDQRGAGPLLLQSVAKLASRGPGDWSNQLSIRR